MTTQQMTPTMQRGEMAKKKTRARATAATVQKHLRVEAEVEKGEVVQGWCFWR